MADLSNAQKKEWAKTLYLRENLTQQEIADRVGVSRVTVSNWVRAEGERFPSSKEADILGKLSAAIRNMEQETGIADIISVLTGFIEWLRPLDLDKAKELTRLSDAYIKDKL